MNTRPLHRRLFEQIRDFKQALSDTISGFNEQIRYELFRIKSVRINDIQVYVKAKKKYFKDVI